MLRMTSLAWWWILVMAAALVSGAKIGVRQGPAVTRPATAEDHTLHPTTTGKHIQPLDGGAQKEESQTTEESATKIYTTESQNGGGENMGQTTTGRPLTESAAEGGGENGGENVGQTTTERPPTDSAAEGGGENGGENEGQTTTGYQPTDEATKGGGEEGEGESKGQTTTEKQSADGATEGGGESGVGNGGDGNSSTTATTPAVITLITQVPAVITTTEMTSTTEMNCGVNADLVQGRCVCATNWTHDPGDPGSHCPCPDLCSGEEAITCPPEGSCYHMTCHLVSCTCPGHHKFDPYTRSCKSLCQYYGDAVCGLGSHKKCVDSDTEEGGFTCSCDEGYVLTNGSCQDVDECGGSSPACGHFERCLNTDGSHTCACQEGALRASNGSCSNVNECLNPALYDCDHICHDADPPVMYTCDCHTGFTWNNTQRRCVLENEATACECSDPKRSICYKPPEGEKVCYSRPGYQQVNGTFYDVAECKEEEAVRAWCWERGVCVEGVGGSRCLCQEGYTNATLNYGQCVAIECPAGTLLSGSVCVDPCTIATCTPPLTCALTSAGQPECRCLSACQSLLQANLSTSVYHGSLTASTVPGDSHTARRVTRALEMYFGQDTVEVVNTQPQHTRKRSVSQMTNVQVEFLVTTSRPNMTQEVAEIIKKQCEASKDAHDTCILPGGLVVMKDSITVDDRDPCAEDPCPGDDILVCSPRTDATGRFTCSCKAGFLKVDVQGTPGFCQDVDECEGGGEVCEVDQDCLNTPGSFVCRLKPQPLRKDVKVVREMAISFGVLFFLSFFVTVALIYWLMKKKKSTRELVPMSTTPGFDNDAYHR